MQGWMEAQAGIKIARRNINNLRHSGDTTLMTESEEELKRLLMNVKEESEEAGLKLSIQKTKIMASGPITSWQIDGETMETVTDFIFWSSKITADSDCSHEIKRCLLLGRKAMTNLDSILKSRDITLLTKLCLVKAMLFPVELCVDVRKGEVKVKSLSCVWLFAAPWTVAYQVPPSMEFSRQEYWNGCHFLCQGICLTQGSNLGLLHCRQMLLLSEPPEEWMWELDLKEGWRLKNWCF